MSIDKFNWDTHIWQQCLEFFLLSSISISVLILGPPLSPSWPSSSNWTPSFVSLSKLWESASILFRSDNMTQPTLLGTLRRGRWLFLGESVGCGVTPALTTNSLYHHIFHAGSLAGLKWRSKVAKAWPPLGQLSLPPLGIANPNSHHYLVIPKCVVHLFVIFTEENMCGCKENWYDLKNK